MHSKAKGPTKAESRRMDALKKYGCICCKVRGLGWRLPDIHHILSGGKRMGHRYTIPLCQWHHEGRPAPLSEIGAEELMGPSLKSKKRFVAAFGTELAIMAQVDLAIGFSDGV